MAGLVNVRINPICPSYSLRRSPLPPVIFSPSISSRLPEIPLRLSSSIMRGGRPLTLVAASLEPTKTISRSQFDNTQPSKEVLEIWHSADVVCFDVDSTVCLDEGIDELADFCGAGKAVAEWTTKAMTGSVPFEEALAARLALFNPSLPQVQDYLEKRPPRISPGIADLIKNLKAKNTDVYLISGGFRQMINIHKMSASNLGSTLRPEGFHSFLERNDITRHSFTGIGDIWPNWTADVAVLELPPLSPVAMQLGIPSENIFANQLLFGNSGEFLGFDTTEPTSRSGGKATAVQQIRKVHDYKKLVMIGDGATDLEARKPGGADLFICYAGVQMREAVAAKADWLVFSFQELLTSL